jgi:hypothetical protein
MVNASKRIVRARAVARRAGDRSLHIEIRMLYYCVMGYGWRLLSEVTFPGLRGCIGSLGNDAVDAPFEQPLHIRFLVDRPNMHAHP